jgi:flagellar hook-basal body complex protein FliE
MQINSAISSIKPIQTGIEALGGLSAAKPQEGANFVELLKGQLGEVEQLSARADQLQQGLLTGEVTDINQVVLAVQKADLAMTFALQLRNKVLEAYQEISRMQI